jgi:DNA-binding MarR family transcriptional regulator
MDRDLDVAQVAGALRMSMGLLVRRLRQVKAEGELTLPESSALSRLDRGGPATSAALAKLEQISPQSMGATLAGLEAWSSGPPTRRTAGWSSYR